MMIKLLHPVRATAMLTGTGFLLLLLGQILAAAPSLDWVSKPGRPSISGNGNSFAPTLSPDGRFLLFVSQAKNLATNGMPSAYLDVYVRDLLASNTVLVSVNTNGLGGGNRNSNFPSISPDGRFVVFESEADNLASNVSDTNGVSDVFLRDLVTGTTTLISVDTTGGRSGNGQSKNPGLSPDGGWVVFESRASNLVTNDLNGTGLDLFIRPVAAGSIRLASVNAVGTGSPFGYDPFGDGPSTTISDSASLGEGGWSVAFFSRGTNLVRRATDTRGGIFFRSLLLGTNLWVSAGAYAFFANTNSGETISVRQPLLSLNSRYVFYVASVASTSSTPALILRYDLQTGVTALAGSNALSSTFPQATADGRFVAFATSNAVILADVDAGQQEIVGDASSVPRIAAWSNPVLSPGGERVALLGAASPDGPWSLYSYERGTGLRTLVALSTNSAAARIIPGSFPAVSADGQVVAFESAASDLVAGDLNQASDIFVSDLTAHATSLVSGRAPSFTGFASVRNTALGPGCVSDYGRAVAFTSLGGQLTEGEDNFWQSAYVRDVTAGTTQWLHSPDSSRLLGSVRFARNPVLSASGRYVAWQEQHAPGLSEPQQQGSTNIFWLDRSTGRSAALFLVSSNPFSGDMPTLSRDGRWLVFRDAPLRQAQSGPPSPLNIFRRDMFDPDATNELVSVNRFGTGGGDWECIAPRQSDDSRWIVFLSRSSNLTTNAPVSVRQVFARDLLRHETRLVSREATGQPLLFESTNHIISRDSRYVFFQARPFASAPAIHILRHDLQSTNSNVDVCADCGNPSPSADGRLVAYESRKPGATVRDILMTDLQTGQTTLISSNVLGTGSPGGNFDSFSPQLSYDGRYVVFASRARNLVQGDANNLTDVFVHDRAQHVTIPLSRSFGHAEPANGFSSAPVLAADGRTVTFLSFAADVASGELDGTGQIYLARLGGADTDADGLEDDWEMAYFNTLDRDGTGDFDGDGWTDLQEFRAGTDPTNAGSVLRVITVTSPSRGPATILWTAQPGRSYRVQFRRDFPESFWSDLSGAVTATTTVASKEDPDAAGDPERFYRVLLEPF